MSTETLPIPSKPASADRGAKRSRYFGTDGVRGVANRFPVDPQTVLQLAMAAAQVLKRSDVPAGHRRRVLIAKDTRLSGYMLEALVMSGFTAMGFDVALVGPLPTPAISYLTRSLRADAGVMVSASHNPYQDNGIKLFDSRGLKLSDEQEQEIAEAVSGPFNLAPAEQIGRATRYEDARGRYIEFLKNHFPSDLTLDGWHIVIDCAHGAGYRVAPTIFTELGAQVTTIGISPDGTNINQKCGATSPLLLSQTVSKLRADLGIALDGDADRAVIVDEQGNVVDGERILALIAQEQHRQDQLQGPVISTIVANQGLEDTLHKDGLEVLRVGVGDRQILAAMLEHQSSLGGEPSGHFIFGQDHPTGDGIMTGLKIAAIARRSQQGTLSQMCQSVRLYPQRSLNIPIPDDQTHNLLENPAFQECTKKVQLLLKTGGRLVIRPSGTEPLLRILVEAQTQETVDQAINLLLEVLQHRQPSLDHPS